MEPEYLPDVLRALHLEEAVRAVGLAAADDHLVAEADVAPPGGRRVASPSGPGRSCCPLLALQLKVYQERRFLFQQKARFTCRVKTEIAQLASKIRAGSASRTLNCRT